jgi:hypothetical protein
MEFNEFVQHAVNKLVEAETLVVDQVAALGFPTVMVLIPHTCPLFIWIQPETQVIPGWQEARARVQSKLEAVGAAWRDVLNEVDLADVLNEIAAAKQAQGIDLPNSLASVDSSGSDAQASQHADANEAGETSSIDEPSRNVDWLD